MQFLILIPARGGSKRIPNKNIVPLDGVPLIGHTLNQLDNELKKHSFVSSDSQEIISYVKSLGFKTILRSPEASNDDSSTEDVIFDTLENLKDSEYANVDWIITLPPTSPLRRAETIFDIVKQLDDIDSSIDCIMTMTENRGDFWKLDENGFAKRVLKDAPRRQQDRIPLFEENSAVYATRRTSLMETQLIFGRKVKPHIINKIEAFDINTIEDIAIASALINQKSA